MLNRIVAKVERKLSKPVAHCDGFLVDTTLPRNCFVDLKILSFFLL